MPTTRHWGLVLAFLAGLWAVTTTAAQDGTTKQDTKTEKKKDDTKADDQKKGDDQKKTEEQKKDEKDLKKDETKQEEKKKRDAGQDEAPVVPAWKFDAPFSQTWTTTIDQTVTVGSKDATQGKEPVKYHYDLTTKVTWTPKAEAGATAQDGKGTQLLMLTVDDVTVTGKAGERAMEADAVGPAAALKRMQGAAVAVRLELPSMKAQIVDFDRTRASLPPEAARLLSEGLLLAQVQAAFPPLPGKKDATATAPERTVPTGFGKYTVKSTYTNTGAEGKKVNLKVDADWSFAPGGGSGGMKIDSAELKNAKLTGAVVFDAAKGMVESSSLKGSDITQTLKVSSGKDSYEVVVVMTYDQKVTTTGRK